MMHRNFPKKMLSLTLLVGLLFLFGCTKTLPTTTTDDGTLSTGTTSITDTMTTGLSPTLSGQDTSATNSITPKVRERQTYLNKADKFSVQFPSTRTFQEKVFGSSVMFFTPLLSGDTIKENVGIMKKTLDKEYTLDEYYAITKPELIKLIPGFVEVSKTALKVNDIDAQKIIYTGTQGSTKLKWEQVYLIKNKSVYILTYTATAATFDEYAQKINEMVATLEIK